MTQEITPVPVDAKTPDWPRKVATVVNRLQNTAKTSGTTATWGSITGTLSGQTDLQNALNLKANLAGPTFTGTVVLPATTSIGTVSNTELSYLDGVTSAIQTQIDGKQATDATLTALAAYNTNGLLTQTAADTFTGRTITAGSAKISISNGNGVAGNPTLDLGSVASTDLSDSANIARLNGGQTFSADISVPDEAYGPGWNGSTEVPTKNALYDKIETISGGGVSDGDKGDITVSSSGTVWTVDNDAITYAKMQNVSAASRLLGRGSAGGSGDVEELTVGLGLEFNSTTLRQASGTSFPGSPTTGDLFWRSDRSFQYVHDGTQWLTTQLFSIQSMSTSSSGASSDLLMGYLPVPFRGTYSLYIERVDASVFRNAAGEWDVLLQWADTAGTLTTIATLDGSGVASSTWTTLSATVGSVLSSSARHLGITFDEISGTATHFGSAVLFYRLVG